MKITFNNTQEDFNKFFNVLSVYKTYAELMNYIPEDKEIEPPLSAIDLFINKIAFMIVDNSWYESSLQEEEVFAMTQYLIGMGKTCADQETLSIFKKEGHTLSIDLVKVWEQLLKDGIEI